MSTILLLKSPLLLRPLPLPPSLLLLLFLLLFACSLDLLSPCDSLCCSRFPNFPCHIGLDVIVDLIRSITLKPLPPSLVLFSFRLPPSSPTSLHLRHDYYILVFFPTCAHSPAPLLFKLPLSFSSLQPFCPRTTTVLLSPPLPPPPHHPSPVALAPPSSD